MDASTVPGVFAALPIRKMSVAKISDLFAIDVPDQAVVRIYDEPTPFVPQIDPDYTFTKAEVKAVLRWLSGRYKSNLLVTGPTGCGKSTLIEQTAARMGIEVFRVACHSRLEYGELLGTTQLVSNATTSKDVGLFGKAACAIKKMLGGLEEGESLLEFASNIFGSVTTKFEYGPAINAAARFDGGILLLDEINFVHPSTVGALNTLLDGGSLLVPDTGEAVRAKPGFRIAVTGNSMDDGEDATLYRGVQRMNIAFKDRCLSLRRDYLDTLSEAKILAKVAPTLPGHIVSTMVETAKEVRDVFKAGVTETVISTRNLISWARLVADDPQGLCVEPSQTLQDALCFVTLDGAKEEDRRAILMSLRKSLDANPGAQRAVEGVEQASPVATPVGYTMSLFVSANNGSTPKFWGGYTRATDDVLFYGPVSGPIKTHPQQRFYIASKSFEKLSPQNGKPPYFAMTPFESANPSGDVDELTAAWKNHLTGHTFLLSKHLMPVFNEMCRLVHS